MSFNIFLLVIIAINVIFSLKGFEDLSFFRKYEFHVSSIRSGEKARLLTSGFLHVDTMHLVFNMYALYSFAPFVFSELGNFYFVLIYFISLVLGNLFTLFLNKEDYSYRAVGASGAVTGIIYSAILLNPNLTLGLFFIIPVPAYLFGIGYLFYSIYGMKTKNDNIGHTAHFGGAIGGYIFTLIRMPNLLFENTLMVVLLAIPIIVLLIMAKKGKL